MRHNYFLKHAVAVLFIACIDVAVSQPARHQETVAIVRGVDLKAGITSSQATAIAELYFHAYVSGCGGAWQPVDGGNRWEVTPRVGYAGTPDKNPIIIDKHTGQVSWGTGPAFANLEEFLRKASP